MLRKICSILLGFCILASAFPFFAFAEGSEYTSTAGFYQWIAGKDSPLHGVLNGLIGYSLGSICPTSEDGYHHASSYQKAKEDGRYECICTSCGKSFVAHESDLKQSYTDQVNTMPLSGLSSDGSFLCVSKHSYTCFDTNDGNFYCSHSSKLEESPSKTLDNMRGYSVSESEDFIVSLRVVSASPVIVSYFRCYFSFNAPIDGYYTRIVSESSVCSYAHLSSSNPNPPVKISRLTYSASNSSLYSKGSLISDSVHCNIGRSSLFSFSGYCNPPIYKVIPLASIDTTTGQYAPTTRPTAITGGNYGIVGDNGQITKIEDNSTIINETNNTYYNPATGQTVPITDWSYNYEDRSYTVTTDSGNTSTITYGDENISIVENNVVEGGDTITNNYTIYYVTNNVGGGGDNPENPDNPDDPNSGSSSSSSDTPACSHDWQETSRTEPTCTTPGKVVLACSKCGETKTETLNATGHTWQVLRTVQTAYDDEGNLTQQGYTIYQCAVCSEQYKDDQGTGPPGGSGSSGEEKETIWDKIGKFFGSIVDGIGKLLEAVLGKLLDALTSLAEMLMEKITAVVETVLSLFDELPKIFGGFLDFLSAVFPFLPPELTMLLTFGVVAVVFIGILKAVRR